MMVYFDCEVCYQRVQGSDDYINHLQLYHNVSRGFQRYLNRALAIMKAENICESEVITLDKDDDQDMSINPDHEANQSDQNYENLIREKVKKTVEELFQPIKTLLTENVVSEPAQAFHEKIDSSKAEKELLRSCGRMRDLIDQINCTEEMFIPLPTRSDPLKPQPRKISIISRSPSRSEKSSASSCSVRSLYQCPKCDFKITKKQMKENENAKHLSRHHKVDQKTYDRDRLSFHFKKVPII